MTCSSECSNTSCKNKCSSSCLGSCKTSTCATNCAIGCFNTCFATCGKSCKNDCIGSCNASCEYGCGEACTGMVTKSTYKIPAVSAPVEDPEPNHTINDEHTTQKVYNQDFATTQNAVNVDPDYYTKFNKENITRFDTVEKVGYDQTKPNPTYPKALSDGQA